MIYSVQRKRCQELSSRIKQAQRGRGDPNAPGEEVSKTDASRDLVMVVVKRGNKEAKREEEARSDQAVRVGRAELWLDNGLLSVPGDKMQPCSEATGQSHQLVTAVSS